MTVDSSGLSYFRYWVHIEMRYCNIRRVYKWWMWTMHFPSLRPDALESKTRIQSLLLFIFRSNISSSLDRQLFGASGRDPSRWRRVSSFRLHLLLFSSSFLHRYWRRTKTNLLLWTFRPFWLCKREQNSCHGDCIPPPPKWSICTIPGAMGINWLPRNGWPFHSWLRLIRIHRILCCCSVSVGPDSLFFWVASFCFFQMGRFQTPIGNTHKTSQGWSTFFGVVVWESKRRSRWGLLHTGGGRTRNVLMDWRRLPAGQVNNTFDQTFKERTCFPLYSDDVGKKNMKLKMRVTWWENGVGDIRCRLKSAALQTADDTRAFQLGKSLPFVA